MTRQEQLGIANEIYVLCAIVHGYVNSFCPPSEEAKALQVALDQVAPTFLDLTDELVDDGTPSALQICPACGEDLADSTTTTNNQPPSEDHHA